ncbi:MAG: AAA family ATPase [Nanoarchaeota archaeon]|nr:AAA family ATPase [Nanoarchaeota archaeon]
MANKLNDEDKKKKCKEFEDYLDREKIIIKNPAVFDNAYNPEEIVKRKETYLLYSEVSDFVNYRNPNNLLLVGLPGTGKTVTVEHIQKKMNNILKEKKIKTIKINCADKTSNQILSFMIGDVTKLTSDNLLLKKFFSNMEEDCLLILDEIDKARGIQKLLNNLSRPKEVQEDFSKNLSLILISNDLNFADSLESYIRSSLKLKTIYFEPYSKNALTNILKERISLGFVNDKSITNILIKFIAEKTSSGRRGDCRIAIDTLFYSAKKAEQDNRDFITERDITLMFDKSIRQIEQNRIAKLTNNQLIVLVACSKSKNKSVEDIQEEYLNLSGKMGLKQLKSKSMIFYLLNYLDMQNLIFREIKTIVKNNIPKKEMLISLKVSEDIIMDEFNKRTLNLT